MGNNNRSTTTSNNQISAIPGRSCAPGSRPDPGPAASSRSGPWGVATGPASSPASALDS